MKQKGWKRLVSGALAAQMLCAPAAEALSLTPELSLSRMPNTSENWREGMPRMSLATLKKRSFATVAAAEVTKGNDVTEGGGVMPSYIGTTGTASGETVVGETIGIDAGDSATKTMPIDTETDADKETTPLDGETDIDGETSVDDATINADKGEIDDNVGQESDGTEMLPGDDKSDAGNVDSDMVVGDAADDNNNTTDSMENPADGDGTPPADESTKEDMSDEVQPEVGEVSTEEALQKMQVQRAPEMAYADYYDYYSPGTVGAIGTTGYYSFMKGQSDTGVISDTSGKSYYPEVVEHDGDSSWHGDYEWIWGFSDGYLDPYWLTDWGYWFPDDPDPIEYYGEDVVIREAETNGLYRIPNYQFDGWYVYHAVKESDGESFDEFIIYEDVSDKTHRADVYEAPEGSLQYTDIGVPFTFDPDDGSYCLSWDADGAKIIDHFFNGDDDPEGRYMLYFTARWKKSENANLVGSLKAKGTKTDGTDVDSIVFYDPELGENGSPGAATKSNAELVTLSTDSVDLDNTDTTTFFTRVAADVDKIAFEMTTFEPESTVDVICHYCGDGEKDEAIVVEGGSAVEYAGLSPDNSAENPARGKWTATVPLLDPAQGEGKLYNKVEIVVTSPGGTKKTYTIYVQRLSEPSLTYQSGNTPAGMINDCPPGGTWDPAVALENFESLYYWHSGLTAPPNYSDRVYYREGDKYSPSAWDELEWNGKQTNLDLLNEAIVVYLDSNVTLPAVDGVDSLGFQLSGKKLERTIRLKQTDALTTDIVLGKANVTDVYYSDGALTTSKVYETITAGEETLDLKGKHLVPGVYSIEYVYKDPIVGDTAYGTEYANHYVVNAEKALTFHRPLVILPVPGDVDMDGAVTSADAVALEKLLGDLKALGESGSTLVADLFLARVCDVSGDGEVTAEDVELLRSGVNTELKTSREKNGSDYFYWPLGAKLGDEAELQPPVQPETKDVSKAGLKLEYMGNHKGVPNEAVDSAEVSKEDGLQHGSNFWMGIELEDAAALGSLGAVQAVTMTLVYDEDYLSLQTGGKTAAEAIKAANSTYWGTDAEFWVQEDAKCVAHDSKAQSSMSGANLRELRVTVFLPSAKTLTDGWLLKVPLQMIRYPSSSRTLIEPAFGMRELCITGSTTTAAYNCQAEPFGGATTNLAGLLEYRKRASLPLGEDNTPAEKTWECEYGDSFKVTYTLGEMPAEEQAKLPKGITYEHNSVTNITTYSGVPEEVGSFVFNGDANTRLEIKVTPAPLTITVLPQERYYGEENPSVGSFQYDVDQIKGVDKGSKTLTGNMAELNDPEDPNYLGLEGYDAAKVKFEYVTTLDGSRDLVTEDTNANPDNETYFVVMSGAKATNYDITYVVAGEEETDPEKGWSTFKVHKRPIYVDKILTDPMATIFASFATSKIQPDPTGTSGTDFTAALPSDEGKSGIYQNMPLTGEAIHVNTSTGKADTLTIEYIGNYVRTEIDETSPSSTAWVMANPVERRDVTVRDIKLTGGDLENYKLLKDVPLQNPVVNGGRLVKEFIIADDFKLTLIPVAGGYADNNASANMNFTHGDVMSVAGMRVSFWRNTSNRDETKITADYRDFAGEGLTTFLAAMAEDGSPAEERVCPDENGQYILSRSEMNGYYIWVEAISYEIDGDDYEESMLYAHSVKPLNIGKKDLVLTIGAEARYYGEENLTDQTQTKVTYDVDELAKPDQVGKSGNLWTDFSETTLPGYSAPTVHWVRAHSDTGTNIDAGTSANIGSNSYYVKLSGAESTDYNFYYTYPGYREGQDKPRSDYGYNTFQIYPRPIVVETLTTTVPEIYVDATDIDFSMTVGSDSESMTLGVPEKGKTYYQQTSKDKTDGYYATAEYDFASMPELHSGNVLYGEDKLTLSYMATYVADQSHWNPPYFTLTEARETRKVDLTDLTITNNSNYILVFTCNGNAQHGYPGTGTKAEPDMYQVEGTVKARSVERIEIKQPLPRLEYSHGDSLLLTGGSGRSPLVVEIIYAGLDETKTVTFNGVGVNSGGIESAFYSAGLHLTWGGPWVKDGVNDELTKTEDLVLSHSEDDKQVLYVTLEQVGGLDPIAAETTLPVSVAAKELTLTVKDQYRYFGEENGTYEFTFDPSQLAQVDRALLDDTDVAAGEATTLDTAAACEALRKIDSSYVGPTFTTKATAASPVKGEQADGSYGLSLSGGKMANYTFKYVDGSIQVFRRPIVVDRIKGSVASLPYESVNNEIEGTASRTGSDDSRLVVIRPGPIYANTSDEKYNQYASRIDPSGLRLDNAIVVDGTTVTVSYTAVFPPKNSGGRPSIDGKSQVDCTVTIKDLELVGGAEDNYCLVYLDSSKIGQPLDTKDEGHTGTLTAREIESITLTQAPTLGYTYGESLADKAFKAMRFSVTYKDIPGSRSMSYDELSAEVPVEFYYWRVASDNGEPVWTIPQTQEEIAQMLTERANYKAEVGDHLTIAKNDKGFSHQGMALLVLAKSQNAEGAGYVPPVVTTSVNANSVFQIKPLELTYTLSADDKVYDGTTSGTGSIALTNVQGKDDVKVVKSTLRFTFSDANVAYEVRPTGHSYGDLAKVPMNVTGIAIEGEDAANYSIVSVVKATDAKAPSAYITKATREAPELNNIRLSTDMHTNVVTVDPNGSVAGNPGDAHNREIYLEYSLEYLDESNSPVQTDWQEARWFGGEKVGAVQSSAPGDTGFGVRGALPRDTWFRGGVRIGESWNYEASPATYSINIPDGEDLATLVDEFRAKLDGQPDPEEGSAPADRPADQMTKTYRYRLDVYSIPEEDSKDDTETAATLDAVWFNDIDAYEKIENLHQALNNWENARGYYDYYWDANKSAEVKYPLDMIYSQEVTVRRPLEGGSTVEDKITVPENGTAELYATTKRKSSSSSVSLVTSITITNGDVTAKLGDEPLQLEAVWEPQHVSAGLVWSSSDPNVVQVDRKGVLTFVGEGEAVVTVMAQNGGVQDSIRVIVGPALPLVESPFAGTALDVYYTGSFMDLDGDMQFHPQWRMTRGELAMILARLLTAPEGEEPGAAMNFVDVHESDPCSEAVELLSRWGIVNGTGHGYFHPERYATRAEAVVMLSRMLRLGQSTEEAGFIDGKMEDTWAAPYLKALEAAGIVEGTGSNYFSPGRDVTRAEVASFLTRVLATRANESGTGLRIPSDVTAEHWAYRSILRAVNEDAIPVESSVQTEE